MERYERQGKSRGVLGLGTLLTVCGTIVLGAGMLDLTAAPILAVAETAVTRRVAGAAQPVAIRVAPPASGTSGADTGTRRADPVALGPMHLLGALPPGVIYVSSAPPPGLADVPMLERAMPGGLFREERSLRRDDDFPGEITRVTEEIGHAQRWRRWVAPSSDVRGPP